MDSVEIGKGENQDEKKDIERKSKKKRRKEKKRRNGKKYLIALHVCVCM